MRWVAGLMLCLVVALASAEPVVREASLGPHVLTVRVPVTEVRSVDRLEMTYTLRSAIGSAEPAVGFDPSAAGWTVVESSSTSFDLVPGGGARERSWTVVLEPFLPGAYEVPGVTVTLADGSAVTTEAVAVEVGSVLTSPDETAQAELTTTRSGEALHDPARRGPVLLYLQVGVAFCAVGAAVLGVLIQHAKSRAGEEAVPRVPLGDLQQVTLVEQMEPRRALDALAAHAREREADDGFARELERLRFGGAEVDAAKVAELARRLDAREASA